MSSSAAIDELLAAAQASQVRSSTPDPTRYHDPATQALESNGRTLAELIGTRNGLRGVVIPRADFGGRSQGLNGAAVDEIVVDPLVYGVNAPRVKLGKLTQAISRQAVAAVEQAAGPPTDTEGLRLRASAALRLMGELTESPPAPAAATPPAATPEPPGPPAVPVGAAQFAAGASLMHAFAPPVATHPAVPPRAAASTAVAPPEFTVRFDLPTGRLDVPFHDVIYCPEDGNAQVGLLVLVYDNRWRSPKFLPAASATPFAVHTIGSDRVFKVESAGIQFDRGHETYCVLMITDTAVIPK